MQRGPCGVHFAPAASANHLHVLQWLVSMPMPEAFTAERHRIAPGISATAAIKALLIPPAALAGHLNIVQWLGNDESVTLWCGCADPARLLKALACSGDLLMLHWLGERFAEEVAQTLNDESM